MYERRQFNTRVKRYLKNHIMIIVYIGNYHDIRYRIAINAIKMKKQ